MSMTLQITCAECGHDFDVECTAAKEGRTYGRPEDCYEGSPAEFEPAECPECGVTLDEDELEERLTDEIESAKLEWQIERAEERRNDFARD